MSSTLIVELQTPQGVILDGVFAGVEMQTGDGVIEIRPGQNSHFSLTRTTEISLRIGGETLHYSLQNAAAGLCDGRLTIIAETANLIVPINATGEPDAI